MKLSIVIPCYNSRNSIKKLLENICSQTISRKDIEVIVIDDGSSDNTAEVINNFCCKKESWCNFHLYKTENQGAARARTFGLSKAHGDYVFFCDSDDEITDCFVETIVSETEKNPDMIYFNSIMANYDISPVIEKRKVFFDFNKTYEDKNDFLSYLLKHGYYTSAVWTYVFKRALAHSSGANFTNRKAHEDHLFTIKLLCYSKKIVTISKLLYIQNIRCGSLTNSKKDISYINERYCAYREAKDFMQNNFSDACLKAYTEWSLLSFLVLCRSNIKLMIPSFLILFRHVKFLDDVGSILYISIKKLMKL